MCCFTLPFLQVEFITPSFLGVFFLWISSKLALHIKTDFALLSLVNLVVSPLLSQWVMRPGAQCWITEGPGHQRNQRKDCLRENQAETVLSAPDHFYNTQHPAPLAKIIM